MDANHASLEELACIDLAVDRVLPMAERAKVETSRDYWLLLIGACHRAGRLDLMDLLSEDDKGFAADVFGIRNYFDQKTGQWLSDWRPASLLPPPAPKPRPVDLDDITREYAGYAAGGDGKAKLDGDFTADELEKIAKRMRENP